MLLVDLWIPIKGFLFNPRQNVTNNQTTPKNDAFLSTEAHPSPPPKKNIVCSPNFLFCLPNPSIFHVSSAKKNLCHLPLFWLVHRSLCLLQSPIEHGRLIHPL